MFNFNLVVMASLRVGTSDRDYINLDIGVRFRVKLGLGLISREKELTRKPPCLSLAESIVRLSGG